MIGIALRTETLRLVAKEEVNSAKDHMSELGNKSFPS